MPVVTFHVGMPKCATTTIQSFLAERAGWLGAQGQVYERHPDDRTRNQGNAAQLAALCAAKDLDRLTEYLRYFLRSRRDVLLSSEILFDLGREDGFAPLRDAVGQHGYDLRVLVYLKRQDLWIESDFKQHVKGRTAWVEGFDKLLQMRLSRGTLDYHRLLSNWAGQVGRDRMTVVPLNPSQPHDYAVQRFLDVIDLPQPEGDLHVPRQNVSPPAAMIEAARHIKAALLAQGLGPVEIAPLLAQFFTESAAEGRSGQDLGVLSPAARRDLLDRCAASNAALAASFLGGRAPFDALGPDAEEDWVSLSERAVDCLSGRVASSMLRSKPEGDAPSFLGRLQGLLRR